MTPGPARKWRLVREIGLEYSDAGRADTVSLHRPVSVERMRGVGFLVVDDVGAHPFPPRLECRTVLVSTDGDTIFDSEKHGYRGYGCRVDEERFAILRRTRRDLLVVSDLGARARRIDLAPVSPNQPWLVSRTHRASFLIAFWPVGAPLDIAEIDDDGGVVWRCTDAQAATRLPGSLQLLADDSILIADESEHVIVALHRDGTHSVRWGRRGAPGSAAGHLSKPKWARQLDDGTILAADAYNHRVLRIDPSGRSETIHAIDQGFVFPACVVPEEGGGHLVADAGNRCVLVLDRAGNVVRYLGNPRVRNRSLSFPRSVEHRGGDRYLIADTAHDRVVEADARSLAPREVHGVAPLFWPRSAHATSSGTVLIADGRRSRVLEVADDGRVVHALREVRSGRRTLPLGDPHDIRALPGGRLLITDSTHNRVLETDWSGRAGWVLDPDRGLNLSDPHCAQMLDDGRVLIADTGNDRLVLVDPRTRAVTSIGSMPNGQSWGPFSEPKYAALDAAGNWLVVDTGNNRVLISNPGDGLRLELSEVPDSRIPSMRFPRWAQLIGRDDLVVSDHFHHRIVHLRRVGAET